MIGELTPYPKYKDSGVEWLGEVPAHWEVRRLKSRIRNITIRVTSRRSKVIALEDVEGWTGHHVIQSADTNAPFSELIEFKPNDVLFGK